MEHIGIDVHKNQRQICIHTPGGELLEKRTTTERTRFEAILRGRSAAHMLIEAFTESEWAVRCLEGLGHEVIEADPNYASMSAEKTRRV